MLDNESKISKCRLQVESVHVEYMQTACIDARISRGKFRRAAISNDKGRDVDDNSFRNGAVGKTRGKAKKRKNKNEVERDSPRDTRVFAYVRRVILLTL